MKKIAFVFTLLALSLAFVLARADDQPWAGGMGSWDTQADSAFLGGVARQTGDNTFSGTNTFTGVTRFTGTVTASTFTVVNASVTFRATNNPAGLIFDPTSNTGQGCLGIGIACSDKLNIFINAGATAAAQYENSNTGGYVVWRAKANGTTETADFGMAGNTVGGAFQDYGFINTGAGAQGFLIATNAGTPALTLSNTQVATFGGAQAPYSRSTAQLGALAPAASGQTILNSTSFIMCVSTGTGIGAWVRTSDGSTACD